MPARQFEEPRLLELAATSPADPSRSERTAQLLSELCGLAKCLDELETTATPQESEDARRAPGIASLLQQAVQALQQLEELNTTATAEDPFGFEVEPTTLAGVPIAVVVRPQLADVCFAGTLELSRAAQELASARGDDDVLVALETAVRKLRRALRAVLETALLEGSAEPAGAEWLRGLDGFDLESTLAVRRLYARFRRSLRRPERDTSDDVLTALRYAAGGLATLMSSPLYDRARISDRRLLRRLQERLVLWARSERAVERGLELLDDVWTCADLLRDINRRQELAAHDLQLVRQLVRAPSEPHDDWRQLDRLFGLDDALDLLIDRSQHDLSFEVIVQIRARLAQLSGF